MALTLKLSIGLDVHLALKIQVREQGMMAERNLTDAHVRLRGRIFLPSRRKRTHSSCTQEYRVKEFQMLLACIETELVSIIWIADKLTQDQLQAEGLLKEMV